MSITRIVKEIARIFEKPLTKAKSYDIMYISGEKNRIFHIFSQSQKLYGKNTNNVVVLPYIIWQNYKFHPIKVIFYCKEVKKMKQAELDKILENHKLWLKTGGEQGEGGIGWELFLNYTIALEKYKPDYFLYDVHTTARAGVY